MKRVAVRAATALLCLACGDSPDAPGPAPCPASAPTTAARRENEAPTLESAAIVPSSASAADALAVEVHAADADNDRLTMTYEWYRNGEQVPELHESYVPANSFARRSVPRGGVRSDRQHQVSLQTNDLTIQNAPPRVDTVSMTRSGRPAST